MILIMFSAGLGTDIKVVKQTGKVAVIVTLLGVAVPIAFGFLVACLFLNHGFAGLTSAKAVSYFFYGVILTATSVSVTVATLKEMGKLNGKVGTTIVTAAILDDIIGVILLSFAAGLGGEGGNVGIVILKTVIYFAVAIPLGFFLRWLFKKLSVKGLPKDFMKVLGVALAFLYAYAAEEFCGVADITGAFFIGLMLSGTEEAKEMDSFTSTLCMFFLPIFFANIGITTQFSAIDTGILLFGICYVIAGLSSKVLGCGSGALLCRFNLRESTAVGVGMMVRAEVLLICAEKGIQSGMVDANIMPFILAIILISSLITPVILKVMVGRHPAPMLASAEGSLSGATPASGEIAAAGDPKDEAEDDPSPTDAPQEACAEKEAKE